MRRLVIRPGGLGDFIVSLPALELLRTEYFEVWTRSGYADLAWFADARRSIASTGLDLLGVAEAPPQLLACLRGFDSVVSWYGANNPEFRDAVRRLGLPFTFFDALPTEGAGTHAIDFYLEQARTIAGAAPAGVASEAAPHIPCDARAGGFAVIHPFSGSPAKNWPLPKFHGLAAKLERLMPVRWCSGADDPDISAEFARAGWDVPRRIRIDGLYDLACVLAGARLYIGNDSGVTHLAAAVGAPVLALFGPSDPAVWAPRGPNVRVARFGPNRGRA